MDFSTRFLPPGPEDDPPCCTECDEDRDDCGPECGKKEKFLRVYDEDVRQAETDHPMHDFVKTREKLMDQHMEREI